ncbi:MAG: hypothetical protein JWM46_934 [Candidatus Kaiserbacteria bacterium]|nr:hypothetical protein [Candidatus Kaiserbacteria bacterium]
MSLILNFFGVDLYDLMFIVGIILLPVTVGGFWTPILAQTFTQMMTVIACSIVVNIIWMAVLKTLAGIEFGTEFLTIAKVIALDLSGFVAVGTIFCMIVGGPYKVEQHPPDPLNRFDMSHPDHQV